MPSPPRRQLPRTELPLRSLSNLHWVSPGQDGSDSRALAQRAALAAELGVGTLLAAVLIARGLSEASAARAFIHAGPDMLHDPMLLPDMPAAVEAVCQAIESGRTIRVHGDYDVDGVTSSALLLRALSALGARVDAVVPHRLADGYGVSRGAVERAAADGVELLITADCGSGSPEEVALACELGLQVVVTDHHLPSRDPSVRGRMLADVPEVNPRRLDSEYPFPDLSGVGVAFKLVEAVAARCGVPEHAHWRFLDLVALGTVADVSSLQGENRFLVRRGLDLVGRSPKVGISALLKAASVTPPVSSQQVSFILAPRLNAAGRLAHAKEALQLLTTTDYDEAAALAAALCQHNRNRQSEEARVMRDAQIMIEARDLDAERALVLAGDGWHPGVIGIVASRLVESYHRPVFLAALPDDSRCHAIGSARSIPGFPLWDALHHCRSVLQRYGGHDQAGGFSVLPEHVDAFRALVCEFAKERLQTERLQATLEIDAEVRLCDLTLRAAEELQSLEPFGADNPAPVVAVRNATIEDICQVGGKGEHLRLTLSDGSAPPMRAIWFRASSLAGRLRVRERIDVCLVPGVSQWNGTKSVELQLQDILVQATEA